MTTFSRRSFVQSLSVCSIAALSSMPNVSQAASTEKTIVGTAFADDLSLKPLAFDASQLEGLSENLIMSHWQNNYGGSVRALNTIKQRIQAALADDSTPAYVYNDLKREHLMRTGSVVYHEYYFDNLAPPSSRDGELDRDIARSFGSTARWEKEFRKIGAGLGGGSGWVILAWNTHLHTLENYWMGDHTNAPASSLPVLMMDMYEHSYHMDYGASAGQYIDAFFANINWAVVAERLNSALEGRV